MMFNACSKVYVLHIYLCASSTISMDFGSTQKGPPDKKNPTVLLKQLVPSLQRQVEKIYSDFYGTDIWFLLGTDVLVNLLFWYVPVESDGEVYLD